MQQKNVGNNNIVVKSYNVWNYATRRITNHLLTRAAVIGMKRAEILPENIFNLISNNEFH